MRSPGIISIAALCGTAAFLIAMLRPPESDRRVAPEWQYAGGWPRDIADLTRYVQRHPDRLGAWYELAQRRRNAEDAAGALEAWKKSASLARPAVAADKADPTLPFMLGWASDQISDAATAREAYGEASRRYEQFLARDAQDASAWRDLGWCRERLGEPARAMEAWKEAARLQAVPGVESIGGGGLYNLACFRALAGDKEGALDALQRAVRADWSDWQWAAHDEDLQSLHGVEEFEADIAEMKRRAESRPDPIPARGRFHTRLAPGIDPH